MNLYDYMLASDSDKIKWLNSISIITGLPYFGGKKFIGKYLLSHIFNMAARMYYDGKKADIFLDVFGGGGKIALSIPDGWFESIVLNDINYGVYNYFMCCKYKPNELIKMIEVFGSIMSEKVFKICVNNRNNSEGNNKVDEIVSAAMTYWVTNSSRLGIASRKEAEYNLGSDKQEKEEIKKNTERAEKVVKMVHDKIKRLNIIVERLDYRELIKKYNGEEYSCSIKMQVEEEKDKQDDKDRQEEKDKQDNKDKQEEKDKQDDKDEQVKEVKLQIKYLKHVNKLWYFDSPYHPATLSRSEPAPYEDTFSIVDTREMTKILHGDFVKTYGEIEYFIKSDYDPKYIYEMKLKESLEEKLEESIKKKLEESIKEIKKHYNDFDVLEENIKWDGHEANTENPVFYKIFLGEFYKGADDKVGQRMKGREYIWCRGNYIPEK